MDETTGILENGISIGLSDISMMDFVFSFAGVSGTEDVPEVSTKIWSTSRLDFFAIWFRIC